MTMSIGRILAVSLTHSYSHTNAHDNFLPGSLKGADVSLYETACALGLWCKVVPLMKYKQSKSWKKEGEAYYTAGKFLKFDGLDYKTFNQEIPKGKVTWLNLNPEKEAKMDNTGYNGWRFKKKDFMSPSDEEESEKVSQQPEDTRELEEAQITDKDNAIHISPYSYVRFRCQNSCHALTRIDQVTFEVLYTSTHLQCLMGRIQHQRNQILSSSNVHTNPSALRSPQFVREYSVPWRQSEGFLGRHRRHRA